MRLFHTRRGPVVEIDEAYFLVAEFDWDGLLQQDELSAFLMDMLPDDELRLDSAPSDDEIVAPVGSQEVWASGVTYYRSRDARMEEAQDAGGGDFYDRVYSAPRPELFFKSAASRVVGPGGHVRIRGDSKWNVPEPELTLVINPRGRIVGFTIGNDMSSRDIEGENPLYLPQAKTYDGSCAVGPCVLVRDQALPKETEIRLTILRGGDVAFQGSTRLAELKRSPEELVEYLYRETSFPLGCLLMTGTGIVPPAEFTLAIEDQILITIDGIGWLKNIVGT